MEKKHFVKIVTYLVTVLFEMTFILSFFKIDTLNFTMYILRILACPLKTYVIQLHHSLNCFS